MKIKLQIFLVLLILVSSAFSQTFEQINSPYGARIKCMVYDSAGARLIVGTDGSGVFQTTDNGDTWTALNDGLTEYVKIGKDISDIAIAPNNNNYIMCVNNNYIFRSNDGGKNWIKTSFQGNSINRLISARDPVLTTRYRMYVLTSYGVYTTGDLGNTYTEPDDKNIDAFFLAQDPDNALILYFDSDLYDSNGKYVKRFFRRTTNGGSTWSEIVTPDPGYFINSMVFEKGILNNTIYASTYTGVYSSTDFGKSWKNLSMSAGKEGWHSLQWAGEGKILYAACQGEGVYRYSVTTGFQKVNSSGLLNTEAKTRTFIFDPRTSSKNMYYGSQYGGMYVSTDLGVSWKNKNNGITNYYVQAIAVDPSNSDVIYLGDYSMGMNKTTDGGSSWNRIMNGVKLVGDDPFSITAIAVDPSNSQIVYSGIYGYGVWKSTDGGANWQQSFNSSILNQSGSGYISSFGIHPTDSKIILAGASGNLFKSTDRGVNWQVSSTGILGTGEIWDLAFNPKDPNIIYAASTPYDNGTTIVSGGVWKSTDGGVSWKTTTLAGSDVRIWSLAVNNQDPNIVYAGTSSDYLYKTTNAGLSWEKLSSGDLQAEGASDIIDIFLDSRNPKNIYCASSYNGIFSSTDDGQNWKWLSRNSLTRNVQLFASCISNPGTLLIGSRGGGVYRMLEPRISSNKDSVDFSQIGVNVSVTDSVLIRSTGFGELKVTNVYVTGSSSADFSIISGGGSFILQPGQTRSIILSFKPTSTGGKFTSLFIDCNDATSPYSIQLVGRGVMDTKAPTITHTPVTQAATINISIPISATATDDQSSDIKSFNVYYRITGKSWSETQKLSIGMGKSPVSGTVNIPSSVVTADGIDYRIVVSDIFNNADTLKSNNIAYFSIPVTLPSGSVASPATIAGEKQTDYRIFSIPFNFSTRSASGLLGSIGTYKQDWRFRVLQGTSFIDGENTQLEVGKGYFLITKVSKVISPASSGTSSKLSDYEGTGVALNSGWNLIGNPFNFQISVSNLSLSNKATLTSYAYLSSGWVKDQPLQVWSGLAVYTDNATNLKFNLDRGVLLKKVIPKTSEDKKNWIARIIVRDEDMMDQENYFGMQDISKDEKDELDIVEPPIFDELISGYFPHSDWKNYPNNYAEDFRSINEKGMSWNFVVKDGINKKINLEFINLGNIPSEFNKYLIDNDKGIVFDLSAQNNIITSSGNGIRSFKILVGNDLFIQQNSKGIALIPKDFSLSQNYPNPFNPLTNIVLALPKDSYVRLLIYDSYGRLVSTVIDANKTAGYYEIPFDGTNLSSGVYYYKVEVRGEKSFMDVKKMVLLK